jgi:hypothetical protein
MKLIKVLLYFIFILTTSCFFDSQCHLVECSVTVDQIKKNIDNDNKNYKALYFFDPACGACRIYLSNIYKEMLIKYKDSLSFYFIVGNLKYKKHSKSFLRNLGVKQGLLIYLKDSTGEYINDKKYVKISNTINYIFSPKHPIITIGFPVSAIADKNNHLKIEKVKYLNEVNINYRPVPWHKFTDIDFNSIDFIKIEDTVIYIDYPIQ